MRRNQERIREMVGGHMRIATARKGTGMKKPMPPWTIHDLRRTFVTHVLEKGVAQPHVVEAGTFATGSNADPGGGALSGARCHLNLDRLVGHGAHQRG